MAFTINEVLQGLEANIAPAGPSTAAAPVARSATRLLSPGSDEARARAYISTIHAIEGEGGNNATFRAAAVLRKDFALDEATAWRILRAWNDTNARPSWEERELRRIFDNAGKHGTHAGGAALAAHAAVNEVMNAGDDKREALVRSRIHRFTPAHLDQAPPAKEFLWEGAIPVGDVGTFVGPGAAGKSATMVGLAVHMALGLPFLGRATKRRRTVIVSLEDNRDDYHRKLAAWRDALGELWDSAQVADYVILLDLRGTDFRLVRPAGRGEYAPNVDGQALAAAIKADAPDVGLVIIETVSRVGGDESNPAMSALVSACEEISAETGASVVLVGHVSKSEAREGRGDQHAQRGGAALSDNARFAITAKLLNADQEKDAEAKALVAGIDAAERGQMILLRVAKVNCAPTSTIGLVERIPSPHQTVTVALRAAGGADHASASSRASSLARLRDLVATLAREGDVTKTTLEEDRLKEVNAIGITKREVERSLDDAVAAGLLLREPRKGKGGGVRYLPAPGAGGDQ